MLIGAAYCHTFDSLSNRLPGCCWQNRTGRSARSSGSRPLWRRRSGIGSDQVLFGAPEVGPAFKQVRWQTGRDGRQGSVDRCSCRAVIGPGLRPSSTLRPFSCWAMAFRAAGWWPGFLVLGLVLAQFEQRDDPSGEALLEDLVRLAATLGRRPGDFQLAIEVAQVDVGAGNAADQRQDDASPSLLAGQELGARGFALAADAAPDVDFPTGGQYRLVAVVGLLPVSRAEIELLCRLAS
jgi:hypothetical protein